NTLRYLLGALAGFTPEEAVAPQDMPELERWVLHRLAELDRLVRRSIAEYDFHGLFTALHNFCAVDLSAFYFDIRKDRLYCGGRLHLAGCSGCRSRGVSGAGRTLRALLAGLAGSRPCAGP